MKPACVTESSSENNLQNVSYPLHAAGGIRGCTTKEGKSGQGQRELPKGQRGESISTSIFLFFADPLPPNTCQSFHLGGACILLGFIIIIYFWWWCFMCCCCLWLHQWWLLLLRIMFKDWYKFYSATENVFFLYFNRNVFFVFILCLLALNNYHYSPLIGLKTHLFQL